MEYIRDNEGNTGGRWMLRHCHNGEVLRRATISWDTGFSLGAGQTVTAQLWAYRAPGGLVYGQAAPSPLLMGPLAALTLTNAANPTVFAHQFFEMGVAAQEGQFVVLMEGDTLELQLSVAGGASLPYNTTPASPGWTVGLG